MATDLQTNSELTTTPPRPEPSMTSIVSGIIADFQDLVKQQMDLFKSEVASDLRKTREASAALAIGAGALFIGCALLCVMAAQFLGWLVPSCPLWVFYLAVGGVVTGVGAALTFAGWRQVRSISADQSVQSFEENLEWKTRPK